MRWACRAPSPTRRSCLAAWPSPGSRQPNTARLPACRIRPDRRAFPPARDPADPRPRLAPACSERDAATLLPHPPPETVAASHAAARDRGCRRQGAACLHFPLAVMNYFQSHRRLKIARRFLDCAQTRAILPSLSPLGRPGFPPSTTEQGNPSMSMIGERALALVLALAASGTAFNTFIV